jgi:hypothetical protein
MTGKRGAPIGNKNARGRHTGIVGAIGRAAGFKQLTPKDTIMVNKIVQDAKNRRSLAGKIFGSPARLTEAEWSKVIAAQKRGTPW